MPEMKDVYSSHVDSIGYDEQTQELHVRWDSGRTSIYSNVPKALAERTMNAWSVGKTLIQDIKPHFPHRYG